MRDDHTPPGWEINPSAWSQRLPIVLLAVSGFLIAGYLTLFQVGVIDTVWEPFFGDGSRKILTSDLSHILPIPDAALGAFVYLLDAALGSIGGRNRWHTMPWIVFFFGLMIGPLGFVSVMLVVFQPVLLQNWCTLCLLSALISLAMIGPAFSEVLASLQYLKRQKVCEHSLWRSFWGTGAA